jgi:hypothetical protein
MMNWLRWIIQALGANLQTKMQTNMQTNMWLVGKLSDIGRGTLTQITEATMGAENAMLINGADLENGGNGMTAWRTNCSAC